MSTARRRGTQLEHIVGQAPRCHPARHAYPRWRAGPLLGDPEDTAALSCGSPLQPKAIYGQYAALVARTKRVDQVYCMCIDTRMLVLSCLSTFHIAILQPSCKQSAKSEIETHCRCASDCKSTATILQRPFCSRIVAECWRMAYPATILQWPICRCYYRDVSRASGPGLPLVSKRTR